MCQLNSASGHEKMLVRWANVYRVTDHGLAILGFFDRLSRLPREQAGQVAFVTRVKMLHHYDRRKFMIQTQENLAERSQSSG